MHPGGPPHSLIPRLQAQGGFSLLLSLYLVMSLLPFLPTLASFLLSIPLLGRVYLEIDIEKGREGGRDASALGRQALCMVGLEPASASDGPFICRGIGTCGSFTVARVPSCKYGEGGRECGKRAGEGSAGCGSVSSCDPDDGREGRQDVKAWGWFGGRRANKEEGRGTTKRGQ